MSKNIATNINLWWVLQISAAISLIIIFLFQWGRMMITPSLRTGTDFISFYTVGRISQERGFSFAYDVDQQREVQQTLVGFDLSEGQVLLYLHMPYLLPVLYLLVDADYVGSFIRWDILMLGLYIAGCVFFLNGILPAEKNKIRSPLMWGMLTFVPFFHSLILGQDTALLFLGVSLWYMGILRKQDKLTVAGLVLATLRPHICLALAIPLFFRNRRAWWLFVIFAGLLALASILVIGKEGTLGFINLLQISAGGTWYGMNEQAMLNLSGLILRIFPSINLGILHAVRWVGYISGIVFLCILWMKVEKLDERLLAITIIGALLFAPHLHYHDLTLLIVPLVFIAIGPVTGRSSLSEHLVLLPFGISLLLIPKPFHYIAPYLLYLAIAWWMAKRPGTVELKNSSI